MRFAVSRCRARAFLVASTLLLAAVSHAQGKRGLATPVYMPSHGRGLCKAMLSFGNTASLVSVQLAAAADGADDGVPSGAVVPSFLAGASPGSTTPVVLPNSAAAAAPIPTRTPAPTPPPKPVYGTSCVVNLAGDFKAV